MAKKKDPLESVNLLELRPTRSAEWEETGGRVVIHRPRPQHPWYRAPLDWLSFLMSTRRIRLDERGGAAWRKLDGSRTVRRLAEELRAEFGEAIEPAEKRLGLLIRQLRSQDLVVYPGWDEPPAGGAPPAVGS